MVYFAWRIPTSSKFMKRNDMSNSSRMLTRKLHKQVTKMVALDQVRSMMRISIKILNNGNSLNSSTNVAANERSAMTSHSCLVLSK